MDNQEWQVFKDLLANLMAATSPRERPASVVALLIKARDLLEWHELECRRVDKVAKQMGAE